MNPIDLKMSQLLSRPLAMNEAAAKSLRAIAMRSQEISEKQQSQFYEDDEGNIHTTMTWMGAAVPRPYDMQDGTRIIPVKGVLTRGMGVVGERYGMADIDTITQWIRDAGDDDEVARIALHVQSPGGDAQGDYEAALALVEAGQSKPTLAFCDELMCSAAYFIGAGAHTIYATPSAMVGNIGSYIVLSDDSEFWKNLGVEFLVIRSGEFKGAGIDGFTDSQIQEIQSWVDAFGGMFRNFVKSQRPGITEENMQGQIFLNNELTDSQICDFVKMNLEDALHHNLKLTR